MLDDSMDMDKYEDGYTRYKLVNYTDVWGNYKDGYEINNQCVEFDDLYLANSMTQKEILQYLHNSAHFLTSDDMRRVTLDFDGSNYEIIVVKDKFPLGRLEEYTY